MAKVVTSNRPVVKKKTWGHLFSYSPVDAREVAYIKTYHKIPDEASLVISEDPATLLPQYKWTWFETILK